MKLHSALIISLITPSVLIGTINLTSCSDNASDTPITESEAETYIHDRTFSLLCYGISKADPSKYSLTWGTCWIIKKVPDVSSDYVYYIATNWHVVLGQQSVESSTTNCKVCFGDNTKSTGMHPLNDYTQFASYKLESEENFYYSDVSKGYEHSCIDMYIAKADFSTATGSTKTKLNKLNAIKGAITSFTPPNVTDSKQYMTNTMYIGGFPVKNNYYATWETHQFEPSKVGMVYFSKNARTHEVEASKLLDISPQYTINKNEGTSWMTGGASGSMLLTKYNGEYCICGIYWGGWNNRVSNDFYPSFSIFRTDEKDFIDYIIN